MNDDYQQNKEYMTKTSNTGFQVNKELISRPGTNSTLKVRLYIIIKLESE